MSETPVTTIVETPVRVPKLRHDAFFYTRTNREFLRGNTPYLVIPNAPMKGRLAWNWLPLLVLMGVVFIVILPFIAAQLLNFLVIFGVCVALVFFFILRREWGEKADREMTQRFQKEGQIVEGELVLCRSYVGSQRPPSFMVEAQYRFENPAGKHFQGKTRQARPELNGTQLPSPGTPVYVLYFSDGEHYLL